MTRRSSDRPGACRRRFTGRASGRKGAVPFLEEGMGTDMATVDDWKQRGIIAVWRYRLRRVRHAGWHLTADPYACAALVDLFDRMAAPGFGEPASGVPATMRLAFVPEVADCGLTREDERLVLRFGSAGLVEVRSAFVELGIGGGDFALRVEESARTERLWFWWMPRPDGR